MREWLRLLKCFNQARLQLFEFGCHSRVVGVNGDLASDVFAACAVIVCKRANRYHARGTSQLGRHRLSVDRIEFRNQAGGGQESR